MGLERKSDNSEDGRSLELCPDPPASAHAPVACIIQKWKLSDLITFLVEGATQGVTYRSGVDITFGQVKTSLGNNILYYG